MAFNSRSFCWSFLIFGVVNLGVFLAPAEMPKSEQKVPSISDMGHNQQPPAFKASAFALPLRNNRRDLAAAPPSHLASELANATLPARSRKQYSFPNLEKANLLTHPRFQPSDFHDLITPGLNRGKVRRATHTGFSSTNLGHPH